MYGMIRNALRDLVVARHGEPVWNAICARAGQSPGPVLALDSLPDARIYELVAAASEELQAPVPALLEAFGEHWIDYALEAGYREYIDGVGDTLADFLSNLDELHARISVMMPQLAPPAFSVRSATGGSFELIYTSERAGLAPMVLGIVRALARYKGRGVQIALTAPREPGGSRDTFQVREWPLEASTDVAA